MPEEVETHAKKELARLERMPEAAGEYSMARTYLEWLLELPWAVESATPIDIAEARRILDEDHYGLRKVKRRILEFLAIHKLNPGGRSPILCFIGPPGSARPRSARASPARPVANSSASASVGRMTKPRSAVIAAPISAPCPATSCKASAAPAAAIA